MRATNTSLAEAVVQRTNTLYQQQEAELQAIMTQRMLAITGVAVMAVIVGALAAVFITLANVCPLRKIHATADRIAQGKFDVDLQLDRYDEIGQLQRSSAGMVMSLRSMVLQLQNCIGQLGHAAEPLASQASEAQLGITRQREETEQVATAMAQPEATSHAVAEDAEAAAGPAHQAVFQVTDGQTVVDGSLGGIHALGVGVGAAETQQGVSRDSTRLALCPTAPRRRMNILTFSHSMPPSRPLARGNRSVASRWSLT